MKLTELYDFKKSPNNKRGNKYDCNTEELNQILNIVRKINSSLKVDEVLQSVLKNALEITETYRGFIVLKSQSDKLEFRIGLDKFGQKLRESSFSVSELAVEDVFKTKESILIAGGKDVSENEYLNDCSIFPIKTIFCAPLIIDGESLGVIYVDCPKVRDIKKLDIAYSFEILAEHAAIAINNANIHEQLEREKRKAENAEKLKGDLLTLISHEIRNPLNFMMTHAQLLQSDINGSIDEEYLESVDIINSGGNRLLRAINLALDTSEINSGSYEVRNESTDLIKNIFQPIKKEYENTAHKRGIGFNLNYNHDDNYIINCDRHSVSLSFIHLIDNAVKFTNEGEVNINILREKETQKLIVEIQDTGVGIAIDYQPFVYDQFTQEESGYTRSYDGMGLGLALAKSYLELNKFHISFESEKNFGTKFTVKLNQ